MDSLPGVEFYSGILIPGTVNAHCHLELSHLHGIVPRGGGLTAFIRAMGALRKNSTPEQREEAIRYRIARMRAEGIVAVADTCNSRSTLRIKRESPLYFHNFLELFGLRTRSIDPLKPLAEACKNYELPFSVTPHSTYSLKQNAFAQAVAGFGEDGQNDGPETGFTSQDNSGKTSRNRPETRIKQPGPLSIHFIEGEEERELFQGRGALSAWYRSVGFPEDFTEEGSPTERILHNVPRDRHLMLIHGTFASEEEIIALQRHFGENLTWVLCPRSNAYITGGKPPVELLRRHGAQIALGTDSAASNDSLSLLDEMKTFEGIPLEELLQWATLNGAEALRIDSWCGSFEKGKSPGVALLEGVDLQRMRLTPHTTLRRLV